MHAMSSDALPTWSVLTRRRVRRSAPMDSVTASYPNSARVWDVPVLTERDSDTLIQLAEAVAGLRVTGEAALVPVNDQVATLARLRHEAASAAPGEATAQSFARWFFADPWERTISPLSTETVPEYIRRRVAEGDTAAIEELRRAFPGHAALPAVQPPAERGRSAPSTPR